MSEKTFEEAVQQSREYLDWSFDFSGRTADEFAAWRYRLVRTNEPPAFQKDIRAQIAGATTSRTTWNELMQWTVECVRCGHAMTPEFRDFVIDVLQGKRKRPNWKKGEARSSIWPRDLAICQAVHRLELEGFRATRNSATVDNASVDGRKACAEGGSACDAVAEALGMSYKAVEGIWGSRLTKRHSRRVLAVLRNQ